jgi:hypothetical protein
MSTNKTDVYLNISDVASYIGQNKWDYISPFNRLWKRIDKKSYERCLASVQNHIGEKQEELISVNNSLCDLEAQFAQKKITKRQLTLKSKVILEQQSILENEIQTITSTTDKVDLRPNQLVEKHLNTSELQAIQDTTVSTNEKKEQINKALKERGLEKLQSDVHSYINRTHGTMLEDSAIALFEKRMGVKLDVSQKFNKKLLHSNVTSKFNWYICGKVDGLYIDYSDYAKSYVVEVKNRTKSFFNTLREYEKTQVQLYLWMLGIPQAKLVEKYENKIRVTNILVDDAYIREILGDLVFFTEILEHQFLKLSDEQKTEFIVSSEVEKKNYLAKLYLYPMQQRKHDILDDSDIECLVDDDL